MKRILVVGDSWAAGYDDTLKRDTDGFAGVLGIEAYLRQAVSGSTATQWASDFNGRLTAALETPCDAVAVFLGGNDAFAAIQDGKITTDEVFAYLSAASKVFKALADRHPRLIVGLYANPFPMDMWARAATAILNGSIRACAPAGTRFVECDKFLLPEDLGTGMPPHPTPSGYGKIAEEIQHLAEA